MKRKKIQRGQGTVGGFSVESRSVHMSVQKLMSLYFSFLQLVQV